MYNKFTANKYPSRFIDKSTGLVGLKDATSGEIIAEAEYSFIENFYDGLAHMRKDDMAGYLDVNGCEAIPARYDNAKRFFGEYAFVLKDGYWGCVNRIGEEVIPCEWDDYRGHINNDWAWMLKGGRWTAVDVKGSRTIPMSFEDVAEFKRGAAPVKKDGLWGLISSTGRMITHFEYDMVQHFSPDGFASVRKGSKWGAIGRNGGRIPMIFDEVLNFTCGMAFTKKNGVKGFVDLSGSFKPAYGFI